jgi:hypothetical protein
VQRQHELERRRHVGRDAQVVLGVAQRHQLVADERLCRKDDKIKTSPCGSLCEVRAMMLRLWHRPTRSSPRRAARASH